MPGDVPGNGSAWKQTPTNPQGNYLAQQALFRTRAVRMWHVACMRLVACARLSAAFVCISCQAKLAKSKEAHDAFLAKRDAFIAKQVDRKDKPKRGGLAQ